MNEELEAKIISLEAYCDYILITYGNLYLLSEISPDGKTLSVKVSGGIKNPLPINGFSEGEKK